eukprot:CAMPEP_0118958992 /NCGR_PEP_ID=MMETSP1169-20130426/62904_1 /TAXON_ID=36882 /ORGANISM="Pyramimonas obovata, Strain CCMP722" /LENGTH=229 /DNA_ID=CAMNT_0006907119 /DNA_START=561 /DNA_END=1247 /DNA_ORIENTATION=+
MNTSLPDDDILRTPPRPSRPNNQVPSSPFSPFISFAAALSPITPSKTVHLQTYNELCPKLSPAPPSFNTPHCDRRWSRRWSRIPNDPTDVHSENDAPAPQRMSLLNAVAAAKREDEIYELEPVRMAQSEAIELSSEQNRQEGGPGESLGLPATDPGSSFLKRSDTCKTSNPAPFQDLPSKAIDDGLGAAADMNLATMAPAPSTSRSSLDDPEGSIQRFQMDEDDLPVPA